MVCFFAVFGLTTKMKSTFWFLVLVLLELSLCSQPDYYWRDYDGEIPADAVPGGQGPRGYPSYIGQVVVLKHGVSVGQLYPKRMKIGVSMHGVHNGTLYNRILCSGHKKNFRWIPVESSTLHVIIANETTVVGGFENNKLLSIGRVRRGAELIVGKVTSYEIPSDARIWFPYNGEEASEGSYEILTYDGAAEQEEPAMKHNKTRSK